MTDMSATGNQSTAVDDAVGRPRPDPSRPRGVASGRRDPDLRRARRPRPGGSAHALAGLGVRRGDRVAVDGPQLLRVLRSGARKRSPRRGRRAGEHPLQGGRGGWIVEDSGASAVVVAEDLQPALAGVPDVARLVVGQGGDYEAALADAPEQGEVEPPEIVGDGWPTVMAYTSGTTGRPKGVAIGEDDFRRRGGGVAASKDRWGFGTDDVHLLVGPSYHMGPMFWAQMHLAFGGSVVIMPKWDPRRRVELIERWQVTNTHMVPANFTRILELPEDVRGRYDLSSLKIVVHAAAPCPVPLKRRSWTSSEPTRSGSTSARPRAAARSSARRSGSSTPAASAGRSRATSSRSSTTTAGRCRRGRSARSTPGRRRRASSTTTIPTRRRRPIAAGGSPSATPATWTRTATSTSPTARATWSSRAA